MVPETSAFPFIPAFVLHSPVPPSHSQGSNISLCAGLHLFCKFSFLPLRRSNIHTCTDPSYATSAMKSLCQVFILSRWGEIFPQESASLFGAALIRVKGSCLLLLNIPKCYSVHRLIYMLMRKVTSAYRSFDAAPCYLLSHVCTYNAGRERTENRGRLKREKEGWKEEMLAEKKEGDERREKG